MTTTDPKVLHSRAGATERATRGLQAQLICVEKPATAAASLIGAPLNGKTLSIDGDYVCLIPLAGLASTLKVNVKATLTTATLSSAGPDEVFEFDPRTVDVANAVVLTSGTGDGALSTTVLQTASLTLTGAMYARYTLTVGSAGTALITAAEVQGL